MAANQVRALKALEGHRVGVALRDGLRLDDCELVSAGRGRVPTLWLVAGGADTFVAVADVVALWSAA